jgi:GNAT superfamily N-acetyltransferase
VTISQQFTIERFIATEASDADLRNRFRLEDELLRERDPDAAALPHERRLTLIRRAKPPYGPEKVWVARAADGRYAAIAWLERCPRSMVHASRACSVLIGVHPAFRRRGLAKALIRELAAYADQRGYEMIESIWKNDQTRSFAGHLRGPSSAPADGHRLRLADTPWPLMHRWIDQGRKRSTGARIEEYHDVLPAEVSDEYVAAWTYLQSHDAPGSIQTRRADSTARWREQERRRRANGEQWLSLVMRDAGGQIGALLESIYNPAAPTVILVRVCGVLEGYSGRGLRKWLQAELLLRIRERLPQVAHVAYRHPPNRNGATDPATQDVVGVDPDQDPQRYRTKDVLRHLR